MSSVKLLLMDVDGTLTDGQIYVSESGELFKSFNVKDGYGIKHMLPDAGITPVIITGRKSEMVLRRSDEIGIQYVYQGVSDKKELIENIQHRFGVTKNEMAFIGDDLNDLDAMKDVGVALCPADAAKEVRAICQFVSLFNGGRGAIRECIEWLLEYNACR